MGGVAPPTAAEFDLKEAARRALVEHGFIPDFPPPVQREVAVLAREGAPDEADDGAHDLRALLWSSIDNRTSRDLDQVEVAERLAGDRIRLRIGIADVDALVACGSAIDDQAGHNTTSVYAGVAVFPMLPERLSTDLTSLNESRDRLALVIELDVAPDGTVEREAVYRALLRNRAKLVYEEVAEWLDGEGPPPAALAELPGLEEQLRMQDLAAQRLRGLRDRGGALNFESVEPQLVTAHGRVIDVTRTQENRARALIESFMVAANGAMARFLDTHRVPSIRRVVRTPRRWDRIVELAAEMGDTLPQEPDRTALAAFLARRRAADPLRFPDLSLAVIKMLGAGEYILERRMDAGRRDGHFGLAVADYTHATAPNRRFADLVTQRLAKALLSGRESGYDDADLMTIARRCTEQEDAARKVERQIRKQATAVFLRDRVGDRFTAIVTGASKKGIYVRVLDPPFEGRVVRGAEGMDVGDTVRVTLSRLDPAKGHVDFEGPGGGELSRKLERMRRKRAGAARLAARVGESFDAEVTAASAKGTYVRLVDDVTEGHPTEGRVVRGYDGLAPGQRVRVTLVDADAVHGFIDFEHTEGVTPRKLARRRRKQEAARALRDRVGELFEAEVSGVTPRATWLRLVAPAAVEGRLVRGFRGLGVGERIRVELLRADPGRGFIDFARAGDA
ncbi:MAG TPA: RNB domain-containing ribonuclease [Gemmatimonadaceae bacterium]|nr:RNB domain-containing ribonuclease [Gemmatimonadaceae bacterium]